MPAQPGFFDVDDRVRQLSDLGDHLGARGDQDIRFRLGFRSTFRDWDGSLLEIADFD